MVGGLIAGGILLHKASVSKGKEAAGPILDAIKDKPIPKLSRADREAAEFLKLRQHQQDLNLKAVTKAVDSFLNK